MKVSSRDLFLVTMIVALVLGWWIREVQLQNDLARANRWRNAAGTLEEMVETEGYEVRWQMDSHFQFESQSGIELSSVDWRARTSSNEPSQDQMTSTLLPNSQAPAQNPPNP
jgi:hypothetical protein